jgi:hypothetical protein
MGSLLKSWRGCGNTASPFSRQEYISYSGKIPDKNVKESVKCGWIFQMAGRAGDDVDYMHHPNHCGDYTVSQRHPDLTANECHAQHGTLFFALFFVGVVYLYD